MRFTLALGFSQYPDFQTLARTSEGAGWSSICMPDTLFFPQTTQSEYPYAETQAIRAFIETARFLEPIVCMTWMAAVTTRLRFFPNVMKVPMRQPLVLAKALNSLAVVSGERIALGAGLSPWNEDYTYNGVDFAKRGKLMDECIAILRGAMSGEYFEYHSENFDFGPMKMSPVPKKPIPIMVGGHSKPALARAARLGDGWVSANTDFATLERMIQTLNELRGEHGTLGRKDFEIHGMDVGAQTVADFCRLRDIGVTDACLVPWGMDPTATTDRQLDAIRRFGDEVIAKVGALTSGPSTPA